MSSWPMPFASLKCLSQVALVAVLAGGCREDPPPAPARLPGSSAIQVASAPPLDPCAASPEKLSGAVVFLSEQGGNKQVYWMGPAGGEPTPVVKSTFADYPAGASPKSGELLLIRVSEPPDGAHFEQLLLTPRADGRAARAVGPLAKKVRHPSFLPDGSAIVFEADLDGTSDLYRVEVSTDKTTRLTTTPLGSYEPEVEPSGKRVAFVSSRDGNAEIYTLDLATQWVQRLTWSPEDDEAPTWSPDGKTLLFVRSRRGTAAAMRMAPDGTNLRPLRPSGPELRVERDVVWSPDGELVALTEQLGGRASVLVLRAVDGSEVARTESGAWLDETPAWSPDGRSLAFVSNRDGDPEIYRMTREGNCPVRLTRSKGPDWLPRWVTD